MAGIARARGPGAHQRRPIPGSHARLHTIVSIKPGHSPRPAGVTEVRRNCHHTDAELVGLAAVAEKLSSHPVARAIVRKAGQTPADPSSFTSHSRGVVRACRPDARCRPFRVLAEHAIDVTGKHHDILFAHDGKLCGSIAVADTVRADAGAAIRQLRQLGIEKI